VNHEPKLRAGRRHPTALHARTGPKANRLLRSRGTGGVLRAPGEGRVLREPGQDVEELRLPLGADDTEAAWREFHRRLHAFVARRVRQGSDAEDVVQKVFLRLHRSRANLRNPDRIGAWLYQAARNAIADHYRSPGARHELASGDTRDLDARQATPADDDGGETAMAEVSGCLRPMIDRLPTPYRRAIEQIDLEGISQRDAAESERVSLSGMKSRVQRARLRLKTTLLECCRIALDRRGGIVGCETRASGKGPCGPSGCRA
jgi:RNA polymerase sigma-70 factor, ECF subfamily